MIESTFLTILMSSLLSIAPKLCLCSIHCLLDYHDILHLDLLQNS